MNKSVLMVGSGAYLPEKILTNDDLATFVDTDDGWIKQRTGIAQRHIVADGQLTSDLAYRAAINALENANMTADDIDVIVLATTTPDDTFPATAAQVQNRLGAYNAFAFDVQAVCAGFVYALTVAESLLLANKGRRALVIGAESFSKLLDWEDRTTCVLFGDGAGAVILEASDDAQNYGILSSALYTDGRHAIFYMLMAALKTGSVGHVRMKGQDVFRHAVEKLASSMYAVIEQAGVSETEIDWLIPIRPICALLTACRKARPASGRVVRTVSEHANTSAASIPLALNQAVSDGRVKSGHLLAFEAIGGGLSWGAALVRYGRP